MAVQIYYQLIRDIVIGRTAAFHAAAAAQKAAVFFSFGI